MADNLLRNGDFQADWSEQKSHLAWSTRDKGATWTEQQVPNGFTPPEWITWFQDGDGRTQPEWRDARAKDDEDRALPGMAKGIVVFCAYRAHLGGFIQEVTLPDNVPVGTELILSVWAHAWTNHWDPQHPDWYEHSGDPNYSQGSLIHDNKIALTQAQIDAVIGQGAPGTKERVQADANEAARFRVGWGLKKDPLHWDGYGDTLYIYNGYVQEVTCKFAAPARTFYVFLRHNLKFMFQNNDAYYGGASLTVVEEIPPDPDPDPDPDECRGKARTAYDGFAVLLPQDATAEEWATAFRAYEQRKTTFTLSADDAFIYAGKASQTVAILSGDRWPDGKAGFEAFRDQFYPAAAIVWDDVTLGAIPHIPEPPAGLNAYQRAGWTLAQKLLLWHGLKLAQPNTYKEYHVTEGGEFGNNRGSYYHNGLDLRASWVSYGTEITCALAGTVITASDVGSGFGIQVRVQSVVNGQTVLMRYAHLVNPPYVKVGDVLAVGQKIGKANSGGVSTGDHQHLDVWWADASGYADPTVLLTPWNEPPAQFNPRVLTLHLQANVEASQRYVITCKPAGFKIVQNAQDLPTYAVLNPGMRCVYRSMSEHDDPVTFVNANLDTLHQVADMFATRGLPLIDGHYFWWGLWNEKWGYDRADNIVWRDREIAAIEYLTQKEPRVGAVAFEGGVGNIQVANFDLLVSLMQKVRDYNGMAGLHSYFGAIPTRCSLDHYEDEGKWLQYRFEMTDDYLVQHGIRINWFLSEGGAIYYEPPRDMPSCDPGWRYKDTLNGDWAQYLAKLEQLAQHLYGWNVAHGGRLKGYAIFTQGGGDRWKWFELGSTELDALAAMQVRLWPL